jgi:hypothetical protein
MRPFFYAAKGETAGEEIGGSMATADITDIRPNGKSFAEGGPNPPAELWAPPLAPNGTDVGHIFLREDPSRVVIGDEDLFQLPQPSNLSEAETRFGFRRELIAGIAIIAALGVAGLTYFFLASPEGKAPAETAESSPIAVQSSSETPAPAAVNVTEPSSSTRVESSSETVTGVVPSPDVPASATAEVSPQVAPSAVTAQITSAAQNRDLVFLQRPGVNIRSGPSGNAPVLGTAPMGTQFTATSREGDWVEVANSRLKGWINSQFLGPNKPR